MSMSDIDKPLPNDAPNVTLTIRMIMNGKEVGSIIGKGGEIINNIREESGAKIHITDGSVPERIVTVTGSTDAIFKSFNMICKKFEDDGPRDKDDSKQESSSNSSSSVSVPRPPVTLRLIVPASQCGSLIGKGGSKIKEIREITGASIQVASEMLPNSTERAVTISGGSKAITQCISQICYVMLESPPKGTTHAYTPKGGMGGGIGNMGGSRHSGGRHQIASHENPLASLLGLAGSGGGFSGGNLNLAAIASLAGTQIRENRHRGGMDRDHDDRGHGSHGGDRGGSTTTHEMSIANDMIGCIIGKGGSKIAEIRQLSGAMIRISKSDDSRRRGGDGDRDGNGGEDGGNRDDNERQITISGNPESVALAKSLINMSLDLHRSKMEERDRDDGGGGSSSSSRNDRDRGGNSHRDRGEHRSSSYGSGMTSHGGGLGGLGLSGVGLGTSAAANMSQLGLAAQLFAKPELATALTTLVGAGGLGGASGLSLLAGLGALGGAGGALGSSGSGMGSGGGGHVTGVHRSRGGYGGGGSGGSRGGRDDDRGRDSKRSKFAPY